MAEEKTNRNEEAETVDGKSLSTGNNAISKGTLIMLVGVVIFVIVATILFIRFFNAPTG